MSPAPASAGIAAVHGFLRIGESIAPVKPQRRGFRPLPARRPRTKNRWLRVRLCAALVPGVLVLLAHGPASGLPFQLLESPSAILVSQGGQEIKVDYALEQDQLPTESLLMHYRYGVRPWLELSGGAVYARFPDQNIERLAEWEAMAKFKVPATLFQSDLVAYAGYRESLGDPVVANVKGGPGDVEAIVSRHADGGKDTSVGILARRPMHEWAYTLGFEYMNAGNRRYGDFTADQTDVYTVYFTPERHFRNNSVMVALENRYTSWTHRGDYYDAIPEVRWEFKKDWVVETGISVPIVGGKLYQYILGFTYQWGAKGQKQ